MSSGNGVLLVPMNIDALYVPSEGIQVRQTLADYSQLPYQYYDGFEWQVPGGETEQTPNLSDTILSQPFSGGDYDLTLEPGVHLHWALPEALTHSPQQNADGSFTFPVVPNRWLVTRSKDGVVDKQWVVESDYLYPDMYWSQPFGDPPPDCVAVPFPFSTSTDESGPFQPFRFMGRALSLGDWQPSDPLAEYLGTHGLALSAMGATASVPVLDHVKATFAAFYPNCMGVFGLHDDDPTLQDGLTGITYDILGFYSDPAQQDCLGAWYDAYPDKSNATQLLSDFEDAFGWSLDLGNAAFPGRMVLYGRLTFESDSKENPAATNARIALCVGNTATEAVSAYVAQSLASHDGASVNKVVYEEQLEAIQLADGLGQRTLDLAAAFQEARHTKGFTAKPGGLLWTVVQPASPASAGGNDEVTLPDDLAHALNQLNALQQSYDRALDTIASLGDRLFSDWWVWMRMNYYTDLAPPEDPDELTCRENLVQLYDVVDKGGLAPLRSALASAGQLGLQVDPSTRQVTATANEVLICLSAEQNCYFSTLISDLQSGQLDDYNLYKSLRDHFSDCGIELSQSASIRTVSPTAWTVTDGGIDHSVTHDGTDLNLHIAPSSSQTASQLANAINAFVARLAAASSQYVLLANAAPRYWQPNDPVALMVGPAVAPTSRFGSSEELPCTLLGVQVSDADLSDLPNDPSRVLTEIQATVDQLAASAGAGQIGFASWTQQPWNPFLLEWTAQYFPDARSGNYDPTAITGSYTLSSTGCELQPGSAVSYATDAQECQGFSLLTPDAGSDVKGALAGYIAGEYLSLPQSYGDGIAGKTQQDAEAYLDANAQALLDAYEAAHPADPKDPLRTALRAYVAVTAAAGLSQALGGFNDALLMMERTLQLDMVDPFVSAQGLPDSQLLATEVSGVVASTLLRGRQPDYVFSPIRSGKLQVSALQIVDTFGRNSALEFSGAIGSAETMPMQEDGSMLLLPRLTQPARVRLRWLSADGTGDEEMNAHPGTTPICGWVLPNNLDSSLMIYDGSGTMLGLVDVEGRWMPAPGATDPVDPGELDNPYLQRFVQYLTSAGDSGPEYMGRLLTAVDNAIETIDPESFAQFGGLSLLMGRPLALVRAAVGLELQGLPARHNGWDVIATTITDYEQDATDLTLITDSPERFTYAFDQVGVPVRIGEPGQLNDGLVGYWVEDGQGNYVDGTFHAPGGGAASCGITGYTIVTESTNLEPSASAADQCLTMLVDPRGVVHATSGVLPSKSVSIPPAQFTDALASIDITFSVAPILATGTQYDAPSGERTVPIAVPKEPGYAWSWLAKQGTTWSESTSFTPTSTAARFPGPQRICEGWLKLSTSK